MDVTEYEKNLNLEKLPELAFTEPLSYRFSRYKLQEVDSWRDLYGGAVKHLCQKYLNIVQTTLPGTEIGNLKSSKKMKAPFWVRRGIYVETGLGTEIIIRRIKDLLLACEIAFSDLKIVYYIDEERKKAYEDRLERERSGPKILQLKWDYTGSYKGSKPISFRYGNHRTKSVRSWNDLYVQFVTFLADEYPKFIKDGASFGDTRLDIAKAGKKAKSMQHPSRIGHNLVVESFGTSSQLIDRMYGALSLCKIDPSQLIINFTFRDQDAAFNYIGKSSRIKMDSEAIASLDSRLIRRVKFLLNKYFENGYRVDSSIDRNRLYTFYENQYHEPLTVGEEELSTILLTIAKPISGKIMLKTQASLNDLMKGIIQKVSESFNAGASCIYTSELMRIYHDELTELGIHDTSSFEDLLLEFSGNIYRAHYNRICYGRRKPDVNGEVLQYLRNSGIPQTLDSITDVLWYLPASVIEREMMTSPEVVMTAAKSYYYAPALPIGNTNKNQICEAVRSFLQIKSVMTEIELLDIVLQFCPHLLNEVSFLTWRGLRDSLGYLLRDIIVFQDYQITAK